VVQDELRRRRVAIELKARLVCDQRLKQRLAPDKLKTRDVPPADMQEIEGVIDQMHTAFAVGRRLDVGEARQSFVVDPTELTVQASGLHVHIRESPDGARILVGPVEAGPGQKLHTPLSMRAAIRKPSSLISCTHCGPDGGFSTGWESCGGTRSGSGESGRLRRDGPALTACEAECLTTRGMTNLTLTRHDESNSNGNSRSQHEHATKGSSPLARLTPHSLRQPGLGTTLAQ
jgi:hypothetical protein